MLPQFEGFTHYYFIYLYKCVSLIFLLCTTAHFNPIWSNSVSFGPISSTSVLSGLLFLHWSYSVHYVLFNQHWSYSVHIGPILPLCPLRPYLVIFVCFGSVWSIGSYSRPLRCYKIHFGPFVIIQ